ncbi:MAG: hypothetical protein ACOCQW_01120 [Halanaerobiaceae bacterium]
MKTLVLEDDFVSSTLLKAMLSPYGPVDIAENGRVGYEFFKKVLDDGDRYDFICLNILVPCMDGQEALMEISHCGMSSGQDLEFLKDEAGKIELQEKITFLV